MDEIREPLILHVVPLSASADDRWRLSDRYVEEVWSEHLGPSATLLARRFGRMIEEDTGGVDVDLVDLAASIGVQCSVALRALARLDRFEIVYFSPEQSIVGVSGFAPSVQGDRALRLSARGRRVHDRLVAESEISPREPSADAVQAAVGRLSVGRAVPARARAL